MRATHGSDRQPSPLVVDLWLGRASLAALKAQQNIPPSEEEIRCVASLAEYFKEQLEITSPAHRVKSTAVREKHLREDLEAAFAALAPSPGVPVFRNVPLWEKLASLFARFARGKTFSRKDASELLSGIDELVKREGDVPRAPEIPVDAS